MSKCYTYNGKTFLQEDLIKLISNELDTNPELANLKDIIHRQIL